MNIKSLEDRIKTQAANELAAEVDAAAAQFRRLAGNVWFQQFETPVATVETAFKAIRTTILTAMTPNRQDDAIEAFIGKVASLQEQIDELASIQKESA